MIKNEYVNAKHIMYAVKVNRVNPDVTPDIERNAVEALCKIESAQKTLEKQKRKTPEYAKTLNDLRDNVYTSVRVSAEIVVDDVVEKLKEMTCTGKKGGRVATKESLVKQLETIAKKFTENNDRKAVEEAILKIRG